MGHQKTGINMGVAFPRGLTVKSPALCRPTHSADQSDCILLFDFWHERYIIGMRLYMIKLWVLIC